MNVITPTPGRVVWYYPGAGDSLPRIGDQPLAAIVAGVWGDRCVNLVVFDANGEPQKRTSVTLVQPDDEPPTWGHARWMPYQVGQAQKTKEAVDAALAGVTDPSALPQPRGTVTDSAQADTRVDDAVAQMLGQAGKSE